jgi:hypothetical protein
MITVSRMANALGPGTLAELQRLKIARPAAADKEPETSPADAASAKAEALDEIAEEGDRMITGEQVRAARRLLGWTLFQAACKAKVSESTVGKFETGVHRPLDLRIIAIQRALESAGVEFTTAGQLGVRLKKVAGN